VVRFTRVPHGSVLVRFLCTCIPGSPIHTLCPRRVRQAISDVLSCQFKCLHGIDHAETHGLGLQWPTGPRAPLVRPRIGSPGANGLLWLEPPPRETFELKGVMGGSKGSHSSPCTAPLDSEVRQRPARVSPCVVKVSAVRRASTQEYAWEIGGSNQA
jgi:hypothetical protein